MAASLTREITSEWTGGFVANFALRNDATPLTTWTVEFDAPFSIVNLWNAQIVSHVGTHWVVQAMPYNASIGPGGEASWGFQAAGGQAAALGNLVLNGAVAQPPVTPPPVTDPPPVEPPPPPPPAPTQELTLTEVVRNDWGQGFVADFDIHNAGSSTRTGWQVSFEAPFNLVNLWNARVVSHVGTHYVLAGLDYDLDLPAQSHISFGFQADGSSGSLTGLALTVGNSSVGGSVGGGTPGGGTGGSSGGGTDAGTPPALSVHNAYATEPSSGDGTASFVVSLSKASSSAVTVDYATHDGTATAGSDYAATAGTLTFAPGETSKTVTVTIRGDTLPEGSETFTLDVSNATGASIADGSGTGTILEATLSQQNTGYLHTDGNQIVNDQGIPVQLNSVSWFGFESANFSAHGLWTRDYHSMMDQMVELGFNSIRIPYCDQMFDAASRATGIDYAKNPDLVGLSPVEILDRIVAYAGQIGLKIVLDHHRNSAGAGSTENGLWYDSKYSEADMIRNWTMLADRYGQSSAVIGADLHNEPHGAATWGDNTAHDWAAAAERIGNAVLAAAPNWLIFVEGIGAYQGETYWWGGDLEGVKDRPLTLNLDHRLVYSPHDYPNSIYPQTWFSDPNYPANEPAIFSDKWGFIYEQDIAPIWVGEWGSKLSDPKDVLWADAITKYLEGQTSQLSIKPGELGPSWSWWAWNPNSGDTGGILKDDWTSVNYDKIALLQPLMYGLIPTEGGSTAVHATGNNAALGLQDAAFSGSGRDDVLFQNDNGLTWFWELDSHGIAKQGAIAWLDPNWKIVGTGDTDGSGKASLLVQLPTGMFSLYRLDAELNGSYAGSPGLTDHSWSAVGMKDFTGDGRADVLFQHVTDHSFWLWNLNTVPAGYTNLGSAPAGASYAGAGDFNGDGKADILWQNADGHLSVSFANGQAITATKDIAGSAAGMTIRAVADFDGDGKADILLNDAQGEVQIWQMAGNIVTKVFQPGAVSSVWEVASVGDLSGDGKADILWHATDGTLYVWNMDGGEIASQGGVGAIGPDWHVVST